MKMPADIDPRRRSGKPTLPGAPDPKAVEAMRPRWKAEPSAERLSMSEPTDPLRVIVLKYIDRMNDVAPECGDPAELILAEFVADVEPVLRSERAALSQSARPVASEGEAVEHVAQAIFDAIDPLSGDTIGTVIHMSDHLFWDDDVEGKTNLECQIDAVKIVCRAAAEAALRAIASLKHKEADHGS